MNLVKSFSFYFLTVAAISTSYASSLKGAIKNSSAKKIYLYEFFGDVLVIFDSTNVNKSGNFLFDKINSRGLYKLGFNSDSAVIIVVGNEDIEITTQMPGFVKNFKIRSSEENTLFKEYLAISGTFANKVTLLQKQFDQVSGMAETNPDEYNKIVNSLRQTYDTLIKSRNKNYLNLQAKNPGSFTAKVAASYVSPDTVKAGNFFTKADLTDPELTKGDMLSNKIKTYFQLYVQPQEQALASAVNDLLLKMPYGSPNREVTLMSMLVLFNQFTSPLNKQIKTQYKSEYPNSKYAKALLPQLKQDAPDVGDEAPNIVMKDTLGKTVSLDSFRGRVVLIDFWASWCGPCRMENPNVVRAYKKYKDKGFTIYSVSLDNSKDKWLSAIKKDQLTWTHVSDLKGWETSINKVYQITGIPATFLVGKDGKIVGKNLRGPALDEMLEKLLGTN